ncbi:MAG: hypothetical protein IPJ98_03040 [Bryobacterales bacterium]|nr:hypothetical protein [Bryobacterales bacterium]
MHTGRRGRGESRVLLRFADVNLPPNAVIRSATLLIRVEASVGLNLRGNYLLAKWDAEAEALGWVFRDAENRWNAPGASGEGSDWIAGKSFTMGGFVSAGEHELSIPLDVAVVQHWVREPDANRGMLLSNPVAEEPLFIYSSRNADTSKRPALEIEWTVPPVVSVLQPSQGAVISGRFMVEAEPQAGVAVATVQFFIDQEPLGQEVTELPYRTDLDTTRLQNGEHTITAHLRNPKGNVAISAPVVFTTSPFSWLL